MNDMNRQSQQSSGRESQAGASSKQRERNERSRDVGSPGGARQSDDSYGKTETGVHKSKLGGTNQQAGSSQDGRQASGSQSGSAQRSESADQPDQSGDTGTDEDPGRGNQSRGGGAGRAAQKPGNQP